VKRFAGMEDRQFEIGGEQFTWVYPYWEDIADVFDKDTKALDADDAPNPSVRETISDFIDRIQLFIEPDQRARWVTLSKRKKDPIPHSQYSELYRWLLEVTSEPTPTEQSSPSEDGQPPIEAMSTAGSS
jgi:hypothetical protein